MPTRLIGALKEGLGTSVEFVCRKCRMVTGDEGRRGWVRRKRSDEQGISLLRKAWRRDCRGRQGIEKNCVAFCRCISKDLNTQRLLPCLSACSRARHIVPSLPSMEVVYLPLSQVGTSVRLPHRHGIPAAPAQWPGRTRPRNSDMLSVGTGGH